MFTNTPAFSGFAVDDIDEARRFLGVVPVSYTDPALAAGMTIKAAHVQELRNALK